MPGSRNDGALRAEALLEHVGDRVEDRVVPARDDELRKLRDRELVERDLRLVGRALDHRRPRPGLERSRQGVGELQRAAHERQKVREVVARLAGSVPHFRQELLDRRIPTCHAERRRLVHGQ